MVMEIIKNINKIIVKKVIEIVFVTCFVVVSVFLWKSNNIHSTIAAFNDMGYTNFNIENPINYSMFPMTDEDAMKNLSPCYITVSNETYTKENYSLLLTINKDSTLDYHYLNISINNEIYSLVDLEKIENDKEISFILAKDSIVGADETYTVLLWLNAMTGNDMQNKNLIMYFDLLKETTKL